MRFVSIALLSCSLFGCAGNPVGVSCSDVQPCAMTLVCAESDRAGVLLCMSPCGTTADVGTPERLCAEGAACLAIEGASVCYVGGHTPYATACTGPLACEPGTVCSPDLALCEQACTVGNDAPCASTEVCVDVGGGLCRRRLGSACTDVHPCAPSLACSATDSGSSVCT